MDASQCHTKPLIALACALAVIGCDAATHPGGAVRVKTDPDFYAPFLISQAIRADNLLFVSGQAAIDEAGQVVGAGDFDAQAEQVFHNLRAVLRAGGSDLDRVIKVTIYVTDMGHFPKILELRKRYFSPPYPADTIVEIGALGLPELMLEIEAVAIVEGRVEG
jgi:reactive intermediate/imine deaminase